MKVGQQAEEKEGTPRSVGGKVDDRAMGVVVLDERGRSELPVPGEHPHVGSAVAHDVEGRLIMRLDVGVVLNERQELLRLVFLAHHFEVEHAHSCAKIAGRIEGVPVAGKPLFFVVAMIVCAIGYALEQDFIVSKGPELGDVCQPEEINVTVDDMGAVRKPLGKEEPCIGHLPLVEELGEFVKPRRIYVDPVKRTVAVNGATFAFKFGLAFGGEPAVENVECDSNPGRAVSRHADRGHQKSAIVILIASQCDLYWFR